MKTLKQRTRERIQNSQTFPESDIKGSAPGQGMVTVPGKIWKYRQDCRPVERVSPEVVGTYRVPFLIIFKMKG